MAEETSPHDDPYLLALASRGLLRRLRDKLSQFFFGDDVFISYARADASEYAASLAAQLTKRRLICYLDQFGSEPYAEMPETLKRKLMRSTALVLVGTPAAVASANVRKEIELFNCTKRQVIPIDVDEVLLGATGWTELVGLAKVREGGANVRDGVPTPRIIDLVKNSLGYRRRNLWQRIFLFAGSSFVTLIVLAAVAVSTFLINSAQTQADLIQREAERQVRKATEDADRAAQNELLARSESARFNEQANNAQIEAEGARQAKEFAVEQQKAAEAGMRRAQELERDANEQRDAAERRTEGTQATILARTPGREFYALGRAVKAAGLELKKADRPSAEVTEGLAASVVAAADGVPLRVVGDVQYAQISPDGRRIFAQTYERSTGTLHWGLWDAGTGEQLLSFFEQPGVGEAGVKSASLSPNPQCSKTEDMILDSPAGVESASFSRDSNRLSILDTGDRLTIWELRRDGGRFFDQLHDIEAIGNSVALDNVGGRVAFRRRGSVVVKKVCAPDEAEKTFNLPPELEFKSVAFRPVDDTLSVYLTESKVVGNSLPYKSRRFYNPESESGEEIVGDGDKLLGFSDDGLPLFKTNTMPRGGAQGVYLLQGKAPFRQSFSGYRGDIAGAAVADGRAYVVTITGGQARVYGVRKYSDLATLRAHGPLNRFATFSPGGNFALTQGGGSPDAFVLWNARTGELVKTLGAGNGREVAVGSVTAAAFSADGRRVVVAGRGHPEIWDLLTGANLTDSVGMCEPPRELLEDPDKPTWAVALLPGGQRIITSHRVGRLLIWDTRKCEVSGPFKLDASPNPQESFKDPSVVAFSQDGTSAVLVSYGLLASASMKGVERRVQLRDLSELRLEGGVPVGPKVSGSWAVPEGQFVSASLSGGVVRLLLQTEDGRLKAWRSSDGALRLLDGSEGEFDPAAWSSNGARVAAVSKDNKVVSVWNADDGRRLISIPCADINPTMIGLSDDGSLVITANADGAARIFPATVRGFFDVANRILGRSKLADAPRVRRTTRTRWFANP